MNLASYICICANFGIVHGKVAWNKYYAIPFCKIMALQDECILYKMSILKRKYKKGS
jgi:hypothetical protein